MKVFAIAALLVAAVSVSAMPATVAARKGVDVPDCAVTCLQTSIKKVTKCSLTNFECSCKVFDKVQADATGCIVGACGMDTALNKVLPAVQELCKAASGA